MKTFIQIISVLTALVSVVFLFPFGKLFSKNIFKYRKPFSIGNFWFQILPFNGKESLPFFDIEYYGKAKQSKKDLFISAVAAIAAVNPEGFTVNSEYMTPETAGYCVALAETQNSFNNEGLARVYDVINSGRANAVGGWLDSESGLYYYDAVVVLQDREKAIELGRLNNQLAIFDLNNMQEIRL